MKIPVALPTLLVLVLLLSIAACGEQVPQAELIETAISGTLAVRPTWTVIPVATTLPTRESSPTVTPLLQPTLVPTTRPSPTIEPTNTPDVRILEVDLSSLFIPADQIPFPEGQGLIPKSADYLRDTPWILRDNVRAQTLVRTTGYQELKSKFYYASPRGSKSHWYEIYIYAFKFNSVEGAHRFLASSPLPILEVISGLPTDGYRLPLPVTFGEEGFTLVWPTYISHQTGQPQKTWHHATVFRCRNLILVSHAYHNGADDVPLLSHQVADILFTKLQSLPLIEPEPVILAGLPPENTPAPSPALITTPIPFDWLYTGALDAFLPRFEDLLPGYVIDSLYQEGVQRAPHPPKSFTGQKVEEVVKTGPASVGLVSTAYRQFTYEVSPRTRAPRELYIYLLRFEDGPKAIYALHEYNGLAAADHEHSGEWHQVESNLDLGDENIVLWHQDGVEEKLATGSYSIQFTYRNILVDVGGWGPEDEINPDLIETLARQVLRALQTAEFTAP